jgi:CubicO group peptidase (beta-lactamase class C family)
MRKLSASLLVTVFLLISGLVVTCAAQTPLPDTPAVRQGTAWLETFNMGNRESYRDFLQKNFPSRLQDLDQELGFREMTGGFDLRKVEESTPTKLVALVQERLSDQFARLTLEVETAEPNRIANLDLRAIPRPAEFSPPHMSENDLTLALRKKLEDDAAADRFAGSALVAKNGKPVFAQAYGLADREHKVPNTLTTRFRIGSMNKMFTATATLQLAQAGKLYTKIGSGPWRPNTDTLPYRGTSAGGGYSTIGDLLRFANSLQNHKLLNADYTDLLTTGKVDTPRGRYGYGFGDQSINGTRCFGHGGGAPGMNGDLEICPGPGYVIAVLANMDPPAAGRISDFVTNRLPQR